MKNDTLTSFIRAQCSSFTGNGCIGVTIKRELDEKGRVELKNKMFNKTGKCLVIEEKEPCVFFRESVLPLAEHYGVYSKILSEYTEIDQSVIKDIHTRFCDCGNELKPEERICDSCKRKRRRETYKEQNLKNVQTEQQQKPTFPESMNYLPIKMVDLKKEYGKKYRIFMDESWDVETDRDQNDKPWYYEIRGKYGKIYLYGSNKLAVHINSNVISNRIERENKEAFNLYLKTGEGSIFLFSPERLDFVEKLTHLEFVAKLIKAKRKKQLSDSHKAKLIESGRAFRFSTGIKCIK